MPPEEVTAQKAGCGGLNEKGSNRLTDLKALPLERDLNFKGLGVWPVGGSTILGWSFETLRFQRPHSKSDSLSCCVQSGWSSPVTLPVPRLPACPHAPQRMVRDLTSEL